MTIDLNILLEKNVIYSQCDDGFSIVYPVA